MRYQYLIVPVKKYWKSLDMKASINLCVKKVSYTTLQKPNPSAHYKTYSILLYNEDNASNREFMVLVTKADKWKKISALLVYYLVLLYENKYSFLLC